MTKGKGGNLPTGTVTFLLTDLEGSTRLWERDPDAAAHAVGRHYELIQGAVEAHGGLRPLEQGEGDSVVAAFAQPTDAVAAAVAIQRAFHAEEWAGGAGLCVRIALHTGEAQFRDAENYFGPAIIRCARLRAIGHGGQTLLSDTTQDLVADQLASETKLRDLGLHRLKDLGRPERVWQLSCDELPAEFPPLRSLDGMPNNLPVQLSSFVGRGVELAQLGEALLGSRLVTLTGSGGCGKTRLALQAAAEAADRFDSVWWVELAPVLRPEMVPKAFAEMLGLREEHGRPLEETLIEQLEGRHALFVIDNCEQVLDATARLIELLLVSVPGIRVLATSREPLGIQSELGWRVPSLDELSAVHLFVERSRQARPTFAPSDADMATVADICARLDGIPLAIELAAARTRMMSPTRIAAALDDRFRLLTGGSRTVMPRQQTLEASVSWSYELLDDPERVLLRRLSVFAGGFGLDAAEAVGANETLDVFAVLDLLTRLVDKSLIQVDHDRDETRYRLLETIRQFMSERLIDSGESDATRRRHLAHFLAVAEVAAPELVEADGPAWLDRLDADAENLRAALEWAVGSGEHDALLRLATALTLFWELRGDLGGGGRWFERALQTVEDREPTVLHARALWGAAHVAVYGDDLETSARRAPEALAMANAIGDDWARARALNTIAYLQMQSDPAGARVALAESIELGRRVDDRWAVADGLKMMTVAWILQGDRKGAGRALADLLEVATDLGNEFFIAWYHAGVAVLALQGGQFGVARREIEQSILHCDRVGDPATRGLAVAWLAQLDALTGDRAGAVAQLQQLLATAGARGGGIAVPDATMHLATIALGTGDATTARDTAQTIVGVATQLGLLYYESWAQSILGAALTALGDYTNARAALDAARAGADALTNPWLVAMADYSRGRLARAAGDLRLAEELHHDALVVQQAHHLLPWLVETIEALAAIAAMSESATEAARLFGVASTLRDEIGLVRWPADQEPYERDVTRARSQLAAEDFDGAWAQGAALSVDDAVAYVSRARGERKRPTVGWASLTPTEERVVALVAEGLTNPQIADRLFVSRATVKVHLAHVFVKLDVSTRSELASEATRRMQTAR